jgi:hypothetical protein
MLKVADFFIGTVYAVFVVTAHEAPKKKGKIK